MSEQKDPLVEIKASGDAVFIRIQSTPQEYLYCGRISVEEASGILKQLTAAIEEAKRQADPFEKWWSCQEVDFPGAVWAAMGGCRFNKAAARKIWDSMVSAKEGR